jgi:4-amino-4-deoxy-L-arabinose transferase and related glycosyltransferases of PMT family
VARSTRPPSTAFLLSLAVLLAFFHAVLGLTATTDHSVTFDEPAHLTAGYTYNRFGDFRLHPENGNLPQRWAALPLLAIDPVFPPLDTTVAWQRGNVWVLGREFLFESGNNTAFIVWCGRAMITLVSAATGLLIFFLSRRHFGWRGAFVSLGFFVFSPTFLAHGALATSDAMIAFFFLATVSAWWRHLESPSWPRLLLAGLLLGLACVTKFSAALLLPMLGLLALLRLTRDPPGLARQRLAGSLALAGLICLAIAWSVIWASYEFNYTAFTTAPPESNLSFERPWDESSAPTFVLRVVALLREWRAMPEAYLHGFEFTYRFAQARDAFLNGERSTGGWWSFFPIAFAIKTTLPLLLLLATGLLISLRAFRQTALRPRLWPLAPLLVLFGIYWLFALTSHLNIGHRHILPTYPVLFVLLGAFGPLLDLRRPAVLSLVLAVGAWHAVESFRARPHYLAYFNQLVGGPANGHRHLVDSSLDWGQELPGLARWLAEHNTGPDRVPAYLAYFGTADPAYEGVRAAPLIWDTYPPTEPWRPLEPGLYCVSATLLQQVYSDTPREWDVWHENLFQRLRPLEPDLLAQDPARAGPPDAPGPDAQLLLAAKRYSLLRFARLSQYLRIRKPDAVIGHALFIHRLDRTETDAVLHGSPADFAAAMERLLATQRTP